MKVAQQIQQVGMLKHFHMSSFFFTSAPISKIMGICFTFLYPNTLVASFVDHRLYNCTKISKTYKLCFLYVVIVVVKTLRKMVHTVL